MIDSDDRAFPEALTAVAGISFDYDGGEGVDYEPYSAFPSAEETTDWIRAWTGNQELDGDAFLPFGMDGTGGQVAFRRVRPGRPLVEQPVVFLGSEGEVRVLSQDLSGFLWLLADGFGPLDFVWPPARTPRPRAELAAIAERHGGAASRRPAAEIVGAAAAEFPDFEDEIFGMCR
ncbi:SMI1/KNR4 family protein [Streptomyces sp. NPDC006339]|uniref:SMI1/KNR4 family protein n=1 Tax=Streptomyces sp. NPDC006339 TaxID=3156755 RepID=UPI0033AE3421